jgi:EAL domain-containing protein (putative c-di-GMP-specific phosphodiesterase class I)
MDDFGSGMTSFNYLRNMPVEFLKIDGSFVKDMLDDPMNHSMVEAINQIGHVLGKKTIAEFAENAEIIAELQRIGVDYAQGFGVREPQPFSEPRWHSHRAAQGNSVALT